MNKINLVRDTNDRLERRVLSKKRDVEIKNSRKEKKKAVAIWMDV